MNNTPLVSVIIPAYNAGRHITDTIKSVLSQTYEVWELIIIDDGSKDNTPEIVKPFLTDPRITYVLQQNKGVSVARNNGLKQSKGEFVVFLDADDIWHKEFLEKGTSILINNPQTGVVTSNAACIDEKGDPLDISFKGHSDNVLGNIIEFSPGYSTCPSNILCRRSLVEKIDGFNTELSNAADKLFLLELAMLTHIHCIKNNLLYYRIHSSSMSKNIDLMAKDYLTFFNILDKENAFEDEKHRKNCRARMYKICAGGYFNNHQYINMLKFLLKSVITSPGFWMQKRSS